jgi:pimeloyl-ACP methyl ester carboxylesterase
LIIYEPTVTFHTVRADVIANMEQALEANDREQVVTIFLRDQLGTPIDRIALMKSSPIWPVVLDISPTLPRESRAVNTLRVSGERVANWKTPTTVLLGSTSTGILRDAAYYLRDTIPGCRMVVLEGQGHGAMTEAPDFFAGKIVEVANTANLRGRGI